MDLNKLRDRAYKTACEHGFHDKEYSDEHWLMLVITEIAEAVQADRKNKHADIEYFKEHDAENSNAFKYYFETCIKESIEDELSDIVIRLLDFAGLIGIDLSNRFIMYYVVSGKNTFTENMYHIIRDIANYKYTIEELANYSIRQVVRVAEIYHIELFQYIEWKMKYNELRPYKNGKEY